MRTSNGSTRDDLLIALWVLGALLFWLGLEIGYAVGTGRLHL